jgi:peptidoglycan-N-acetylmuramic acid deacetylase
LNLKRILIGLVIGAVVAFLWIGGGKLWSKSGLTQNEGKKSDGETADGATNGETGDEAGDGLEAEDVRYITKQLVANLKSESEYASLSNEKLAWWFKRDDNHGPSDCDHTIDISEYDGYYLDTRVWSEADDANGGEQDDELGEVAGGNTDSAEQGEMTDSDTESSETEKVIYLTIDCGYDNGLTAGMLDVMKKYDVPACFFVTQTYIRDNVELVKRMKEEGHQVGNHTITHPVLTNKSYSEILQELSGCYDYMKEATGYDMDPYFRPPCGEYSERVLAIAKDLGYKTIFWSMAFYDYDVNKQPGADYVIEHFNKYAHNGAIILLHNVSTSNAEALETVIKNLQAQGYRFASLNELE